MAIGVLLVLNAGVYAAVIRPLVGRVSNVTERTQIAEGELAAARLAQSRASSRAHREVAGVARAGRVLPRRCCRPILPSAAPAVFPRLVQMARQADLEATSSTPRTPSEERNHQLTQLTIQMELTGRYAGRA